MKIRIRKPLFQTLNMTSIYSGSLTVDACILFWSCSEHGTRFTSHTLSSSGNCKILGIYYYACQISDTVQLSSHSVFEEIAASQSMGISVIVPPMSKKE